MKDYTITSAGFGSENDCFFSEVKLEAPDKTILYVSFSECDEEPRFYKSGDSIFGELKVNRGEARHEKELNRFCFLSGED